MAVSVAARVWSSTAPDCTAASARGAFAGNDDNLRRIGELTKELGLEGS